MPPVKRKHEADDSKTASAASSGSAPASKKRAANTLDEASAKLSCSPLGFGLEWKQHGDPDKKGIRPLYYLHSTQLEGRAKVAAFDIDGTLIVTKTGKTFAKDAADWTWFDKCVPARLRQLHADDHRLVFITNQAGIEKGRVKFAELQRKFEAMLRELAVPVCILISTGETHYRKPSPEMWHFLTTHCSAGVAPRAADSLYVGDAAGRPKNWAPGRGKDFSCGDRMFAHNCGLAFHTPEEFFLGHKPAKFEWGSVDPTQVLLGQNSSSSNGSSPDNSATWATGQTELVVMCGPPASGKSTFAQRHLVGPHGYVYVNRDTLGTQEKCLRAAEQALKQGKSVCVDNTNPSRKSRADYVALAKRLGVSQVRCLRMRTPLELCHHLNYVRQNQTRSKVRRIPDVGYNMFKSQFEEPSVADEGFSAVVDVDFVAQFDSDDAKKIFLQWTN